MFWNIWHQNIFAVVFLHWKDQVHWSYLHGCLWVGRWTMSKSSLQQWPWPIKSMAKILITMAMTDQIQGQNHHHNDHDQSNSRPTSSSWPCFLWPTWSSCQWPIYQYHDHHVDDQYTNINIIIRVDKYQYHLWPIYQHHYYHQGWPIYHYHHQGWRTQQQQLITCTLMPWPITPSGKIR